MKYILNVTYEVHLDGPPSVREACNKMPVKRSYVNQAGIFMEKAILEQLHARLCHKFFEVFGNEMVKTGERAETARAVLVATADLKETNLQHIEMVDAYLEAAHEPPAPTTEEL